MCCIFLIVEDESLTFTAERWRALEDLRSPGIIDEVPESEPAISPHDQPDLQYLVLDWILTKGTESGTVDYFERSEQ